MSDPVRLMEAGADDFELELLRSAKGDVGSDRLLRRTVGAVAAAGTLTSATAAGQAAVAAKAGGLSLFKWIGVGALAGAGVVTTYAVSSAPSPGEPARVALATVVVARGAAIATPATIAASGPAEAPAPSPAVDATAEASASPDVAAPRGEARSKAAASPAVNASDKPAPAGVAPPEHATPAAPEPADARASLRAEVASLDRARGALGRGDGASALRELDRHATEFPRGALGPEATVLRIDALVRTGQRPAAEALAERFLASPAHAAHATRVRSILHARASTSNP